MSKVHLGTKRTASETCQKGRTKTFSSCNSSSGNGTDSGCRLTGIMDGWAGLQLSSKFPKLAFVLRDSTYQIGSFCLSLVLFSYKPPRY
jgi:hypothetical protein